jgi:hypothetical protein
LRSESVERVLKLAAFERDYLRVVRGATYAQLKTLQPPPFASLAYGAGGIAYALWRTGDLEAAARWTHSLLAARGRYAIKKPQVPIARWSVLCGNAGLWFLRALIAHDTADRRGWRVALAQLTRLVRDARVASPEIMQGRAGLLAASTALARRSGDGVAATLATRLARGVARDLRTMVGQSSMSRSFAHGTMGGCYALLEHARIFDSDPPAEVMAELARLERTRVDMSGEGFFRFSWCRGAAGAALLWAKAFDVTRDPRSLARARASGRELVRARSPRPPTLCCGDTGWAFACLALDRVDPARGWRDHAETIATRTIKSKGFTMYPSGLAWGFAGLACFSAALRGDGDFPTLGVP